jgi:DNA-binding CsgD family transcriptional regulator
VGFPFVIVDLYLNEVKRPGGRGYWAAHRADEPAPHLSNEGDLSALRHETLLDKRPGGRGYWAWMLAASIHLIQTNAFVLAGPFRSLSFSDGHTVVFLTLAAAVFFIASLPVIAPKAQRIAAPAGSPPNVADILREYNLSERETEVALMLVQEGLSNEEIGNRLCISERTVKSHVYQIYQKFGVKKRAEFLAKVLNKNISQK